MARAVTLVAVLAGGLALVGCAAQKTVSGWFGATPTPPPAEEAAGAGRVYYAGAAGLRVYSKPNAASTVVGELKLHEKVTRYKVERGYAYVTADASGLTGWVNNSMLLWRLPGSTPARAEPAPTPLGRDVEEPPQVPEIPATPAAQEPLPTPSATPATREVPTPGKPAPSLFDPY